MPQNPNSLTTIKTLPSDILQSILSILNAMEETKDIKIKRNNMSLFSSPNMREKRILSKLHEVALKGNVTQIAKLAVIRPDLRVQVLFTLAGLGAQDEMKAILKEHPENLLVAASLRDISGAVFESITVFQHAIWAMDIRYMAQMMLDCIPQNEQGEKIRVELMRQYQDLKTKGVSYTLRGVKYEEQRHFDLQDLINKKRTYVNNTYKLRTPKSQKKYWGTVVGLAQTKLPAHIRHHYCDPDETLCDTPTFTKQTLKRTLTVYNTVTGQRLLWTENLADLGITLGLRSRQTAGEPAMRDDPSQLVVAKDLFSLEKLAKVRMTIDLPALETRLNTPLIVRQTPQPILA